MAAERATVNDIERMKRLLDKQSEQVQRGATGVDADTEFHFAIGQATQNHAIEKLVSGLLDVLSHSREESLQTAGRRQASIDSHLAILAAIEKHDEAKAREAMRYHIEQVEQNVLLSKKEKSAIGYPRRQIDPSVDLPLNKPEV